MLCCSFVWCTTTAISIFFVAVSLVLYFTGHIALLPEVIKLLVVACWCYVEAFYHWVMPRKRKSIAGLTAVVTGGGHGIGRQIALGLAKKGVKVVLWDINKENMNKVAEEIKEEGGEAFSYTCDVTSKEEVYETASKVKLEAGDVDILVNNAGVVTGKKFLSCSDKDIEKTINVNLMAHFWTLKAFLDGMVERDSGHIVAIASIAGGLMGGPSMVDYSVSKTGVVMMMEALRYEIIFQNKPGVHFTTILPTIVDTGLFEGAKGRFDLLPPIVRPEYIAMKTIDAIERNKTHVVLPPWLSPIFSMKAFMPQKLLDVCLKFTGLDDSMKEFTGHKKEN